MTTLTITLTDTQVLSLIEQLPPQTKSKLFVHLAHEEWPTWVNIVAEAEPQARRLAAERGLDWDTLSAEGRMALVDDVIHEGRA